MTEDGDVISQNLRLLHPTHKLSQSDVADSAHHRIRRSQGSVEDVQIRLDAYGRQFRIALRPNRNLISDNIEVSYDVEQEQDDDDVNRGEDATSETSDAARRYHLQGCFMTGGLQGEESSLAAINVCDGMVRFSKWLQIHEILSNFHLNSKFGMSV